MCSRPLRKPKTADSTSTRATISGRSLRSRSYHWQLRFRRGQLQWNAIARLARSGSHRATSVVPAASSIPTKERLAEIVHPVLISEVQNLIKGRDIVPVDRVPNALKGGIDQIPLAGEAFFKGLRPLVIQRGNVVEQRPAPPDSREVPSC